MPHAGPVGTMVWGGCPHTMPWGGGDTKTRVPPCPWLQGAGLAPQPSLEGVEGGM